MNSDPIKVLHELEQDGDAGLTEREREAIRQAIASLSAPQPPAEAQPAGDEDRFEQFLQAAIARSPEPLRELGEYLSGVLDDDQWPAADRLLLQLATTPPIAPVGVEAVDAAAVDAGHVTFESMRQCADSWLAVVDTLNTVAPGWNEKEGTGRECAVAAIAALAQQPSTCPKCGGTGEADSGGVMPWGAPAMTLCECQQPAAVDGASPYPDPRNLREAAALARLALAYLGATSAHIEAAVARCETDLAAQQGGTQE